MASSATSCVGSTRGTLSRSLDCAKRSEELNALIRCFSKDRIPLAGACDLILPVFEDTRVVAGPGCRRRFETDQLITPLRCVGIDPGRPHDQDVDVALRARFDSGCRAEENRGGRVDLPRLDRLAQALDELQWDRGKPFDARSREM